MPYMKKETPLTSLSTDGPPSPLGSHRRGKSVARAWWWAVVYGGLAFGLALFANRNGIGVTSDSVWFMSATQCLAEGRGFQTDMTAAGVQTPSEAVVTFPPGYPALCALFVLAGVRLEAAVLEATVLSYSVAVALSFLFARRLLKTAWMPHAMAVATSLFAPNLYLVTNAWSEMTYMALSLAALLLLASWVEDDHAGWPRLAAAGILTALTSVTRYLGVSVFITGLVAVHLRTKREAQGKGRTYAWVKPALVYGLVTCIPVWTLLARNYVLRGNFSGVRPKPGLTIRENVCLTLRAVADDFCPREFPSHLSWSGPALAGFWCGVVLLLCLRRGFWPGLIRRIRGSARLQFCIVYPFAYTYVLICTSALRSFDPISTRLLAPTYVFLGFVAAVGVEQWLAAASTRWQKWLRGIGVLLLVAGAIGLAEKGMSHFRAYGNYYEQFAHSPTTRWLKEHVKPGEPVFCTQPEVPWLYGRIPTKHPPRGSAEVNQVRQYLWALPDSARAYVVLYKDEPGLFGEAMAELVDTPGMTCAAELPDAKVMMWRRPTPPAADVP